MKKRIGKKEEEAETDLDSDTQSRWRNNGRSISSLFNEKEKRRKETFNEKQKRKKEEKADPELNSNTQPR